MKRASRWDTPFFIHDVRKLRLSSRLERGEEHAGVVMRLDADVVVEMAFAFFYDLPLY